VSQPVYEDLHLPDCIAAENIKEVLKSSRNQGMAVSLEGNSVLVNFPLKSCREHCRCHLAWELLPVERL
jgi:hypothetical protein